MKCNGRDCLALLFAVFAILPRVKSSQLRGEAPQISSSGGQLHKRENVSHTSASFLQFERVNVSQTSGINTTIPNKLLLNYKESMGTLLAYRAMDEKATEHGALLLPAISKMMDMMDGAEVVFADDKQCRDYIERAHSKALARFFDEQATGMYKSDICRFAMLYEEGGYYFDNEMDLMKDVRKMDLKGASFVSVTEFPWHGRVKYIAQAFVAAAPRHPVVRLILDTFLEVYHRRLRWEGGPLDVYGPKVAGDALMKWLNVKHFKKLTGLYTYTPPGGQERRAYFFKETNMIEEYNLADRTRPGKCCCNFFFADEDKPLAWAHTPGASEVEC